MHFTLQRIPRLRRWPVSSLLPRACHPLGQLLWALRCMGSESGGGTWPPSITACSSIFYFFSFYQNDSKKKCVLANNSHILCRTFKNLMSACSVNCDESWGIGHGHFRLPFFFRLFTKCQKPTFSKSSRAISTICKKLSTQHLWTLLTKSWYSVASLILYLALCPHHYTYENEIHRGGIECLL